MSREVPQRQSEQLSWDVLAHIPDPASVEFDALPEATRELFAPRAPRAAGIRWPDGEAIGGPSQSGPMPRFAPDDSEICTDPEWREYWTRQGVLDAVCDTSQQLADVLRRLRVPVSEGHAALDDCGRLKPLIVRLYNEKLTLMRSLRVCEKDRAFLQQRVVQLTLHLRQVAREIQRAYPAEVIRRRGLSRNRRVDARTVVAALPGAAPGRSPHRDELSECNARLGSRGGIDDEIAALKVRIRDLQAQLSDLRLHFTDATQRLSQARAIIAKLVAHAAAMGYSLKQIDASVSPDADNEKSVRAFIEGVKRFEFSAGQVPEELEEVDLQGITAGMEVLAEDMEKLKGSLRNDTERYPFPVIDEWVPGWRNND